MKRNWNAILLCVMLIGAFAAPLASAAGFATAAPMNQPRTAHTATLLNDGKVLVAGGINYEYGYLDSAEIYDPKSNTWSEAGSLHIERGLHTATLLTSGKVLIAGGIDNFGDTLFSAEVYDPASNTWSEAGSLSTQRRYHTATLLPNGKVLVVGGYNEYDGRLDTAEVFDPATAGWSSAGTLSTARRYHTATLLPGGEVLVVGGNSTGPNLFLSSAEVYYPILNIWLAAGSLSVPRYRHQAILLPSGKVLVAGGVTTGASLTTSVEIYESGVNTWAPAGNLGSSRYDYTATLLPNGKVLAAGGAFSPTRTTAEIYDPALNTSSATGNLSVGRYDHTATLLSGGKVLIAGGFGNDYLSSVEVYDSTSNNWTATASLAANRAQHSATLLPTGKVLVVGGSNSLVLSSAESYDPITNAWGSAGSLATRRYEHSATLLPNGLALIAGGNNPTNGHLTSTEVYNSASTTWSAAASLNTARSLHTATLLRNGKLLLASGYNSGGYVKTSELYDSATNTWTVAASLSIGRAGHSATMLSDGKVIVMGGYNGNYLNSVEVYDPTTNAWNAAASLNNPRTRFTATPLPGGKVLVVGGYNFNNGDQYLNGAEIYDLAANTWSAAASLATARYSHSATLLPSGKVLVEGGYGNGMWLSSAELYDPMTNSWSPSANLAGARNFFTSTLLPNGTVLAAGGYNGSFLLSSAELTDDGLQYQEAWRPVINTATSPVGIGNALALTGTQFNGISEASGGGTNNSASNYPVVQLRSLGSDQTVVLSPDPTKPWSDKTFNSVSIPSNFPLGYASVTVFANGIPSVARIVQIVKVTVAPTTLLNARVGEQYSQLITANNGAAPYTFSLASGTLPAGIAFNSSGSLSGTPTAGGTFSVTIAATDSDTVSGPYSGSANYILTVLPPTIAFSPSNLANAPIGTPYSQQLTASGGTAPYSNFAISAGALPNGITLSSSGLLSGTPATAVTANFTVSAKDSSTGTGPYTGSQPYSLTVVAGGGTPPSAKDRSFSVNENSVLTVPKLGVLLEAFDQGGLPLTASLFGPLPSNGALVLNPDGSFTYTPNPFFFGTDTFKYQAYNGTLYSTPQTITITVNFVNQPPSFTVPANAPTVRADAPAQNVPAFATNISPGAPNESAQILNFVVNTSKPALFKVAPALAPNGTLTYTPDINARGPATVSLVLKDDGKTDNGGNDTSQTRSFVITIDPAPPSLPDSLTASGMVAAPFSYKLNAGGGQPMTFSISGLLPAGLALNNDVLSGTPTTAGSFNVMATASNGVAPADSRQFTIVIVDTLLISTVAGTVSGASSGDGGPATAAVVKEPFGVARAASGNIYIAEKLNNRVRKVVPNGTISTVAGDGSQPGDGIPAVQALLQGPVSVALDGAENLYICESNAGRVRKVDAATGLITTYVPAGTLNAPTCVVMDKAGNLFIADNGNRCVRKVDPTNAMTVYAGLGTLSGAAADGGPATTARLNAPFGIAADEPGNLFIADQNDQVIRVVGNNGIITTLAGTFGKNDFAGDGGPAAKALLNNPNSVAVDTNGNVYIADTSNNCIREVLSNGTIVSLAGAPGLGAFSGDGKPSLGAKLNAPTGLAIAGSDGSIVFADRLNSRVRRLSPPKSPILESAPIALPNPTNYKTPVKFACSATSSSPVSWVWDFGDGTQDASNTSSPIHTFPGPNIYTVKATATDQTGLSVSGNVQVDATLLGTIVPIEIMNELKQDPYDPDKSPLGSDELTKLHDAGVVKISSVKLNYKINGKDSLALTASTILKAPLNPNGKTLVLDFGGIVKVFTITAKGKGYVAAKGNPSDKLTVGFKSGVMNIKAQFKNAQFVQTLEKIKGFGEQDREAPRMDFNMLYGGQLYQKLNISMSYKINAKGRTGSGKSQ